MFRVLGKRGERRSFVLVDVESLRTDMKISVIIPCYNSGIYLAEAINSVLRQRGQFELVEVIIIDDRSDDVVTRQALREMAALDRVRVLSNTGPRGASGARN